MDRERKVERNPRKMETETPQPPQDTHPQETEKQAELEIEEAGRADRKHRKTEIARQGRDQDPHQGGAQHRHERKAGKASGRRDQKIKGRKSEGNKKKRKGKGVRCVGGRERKKKKRN